MTLFASRCVGAIRQHPRSESGNGDLDAVWGKGIINSDQFVQIVYLTL